MEAILQRAQNKFSLWRSNWNLFAKEVLKVDLDPEQQQILLSVQNNRRTAVASGTARGKDFTAAVAAICFLYLTPKWDKKGEMIENTKVAMTAPTDRQVGNIMFPEISRIFNRVKFLPGRLRGYDIRTDNEEWFLTGFKADEYKPETWSGFHAVNTMFVVTEASGVPDSVFNAIEGNLQGNSRILIVYNPNTSTGYAAQSQKSARWERFRLDSLTAPNVLQKKIIIPGQVDYEWVKDKVDNWCTVISPEEFSIEEGDFLFEGINYRPNDLFRVKVRGMFPKVSEDVLIPQSWLDIANENWKLQQASKFKISKPLRLGVDVAGMGRDSSCFCPRYGNYVSKFDLIQSGGVANHMEIAGRVLNILKPNTESINDVNSKAFIDTIGEGAGVFSRLEELKTEKVNKWLINKVYSVKFSEGAEMNDKPLTDITGQYEFLNMRAYLYWAIRDWLNPLNKNYPCLPLDDELNEELTETKYWFKSNGKIQIEAKEDLKVRLKRSPDKSDALANTFYPVTDIVKPTKIQTGYFR